jgi:putative nucleotidyltransferase with HDIG domain
MSITFGGATSAATNRNRREQFANEVERLTSMPGIAAILQPLMSYLQQPFEKQDMQRIVDLISHDNSLTAQCLHMANSPLYGRWQAITSVRAAVVALGLARMREIAISCFMLQLMPAGSDELNPVVFWEHSLACALVARKLAKRIGVRDPEMIYLAALLHDLGFMVNLRIAFDEFALLLRRAQADRLPLDELEQEAWGCSHCDIGGMLARKWELNPLIEDVIKYHHHISQLSSYGSTIALVSLCDQLCRANGLGYGFTEDLKTDWKSSELLPLIQNEWPIAKTLNWEQVEQEMVGYLNEVKKLVGALFRMA